VGSGGVKGGGGRGRRPLAHGEDGSGTRKKEGDLPPVVVESFQGSDELVSIGEENGDWGCWGVVVGGGDGTTVAVAMEVAVPATVAAETAAAVAEEAASTVSEGARGRQVAGKRAVGPLGRSHSERRAGRPSAPRSSTHSLSRYSKRSWRAALMTRSARSSARSPPASAKRPRTWGRRDRSREREAPARWETLSTTPLPTRRRYWG